MKGIEDLHVGVHPSLSLSLPAGGNGAVSISGRSPYCLQLTWGIQFPAQ